MSGIRAYTQEEIEELERQADLRRDILAYQSETHRVASLTAEEWEREHYRSLMSRLGHIDA